MNGRPSKILNIPNGTCVLRWDTAFTTTRKGLSYRGIWVRFY